MARIRTVKPEMAQDEDLSECTIEAQLLAVRILTHSDDEGYFKANAKLVKATCFPLADFDSRKIHGMLIELSNAGYLRLFEGSNGKEFGHVIGFTKHQRVNRPSPSKIGPFDTGETSSHKAYRPITDNSMNDHGAITGGKEQGREQGKEHENNCAEPKVSTPKAPSVIAIPTNRFNTTGEEYPVTQDQVEEWQQAYPAVNVIQTLREIRAWNMSNDTKRKTKTGVAKHINAWLAKEQNKGGQRVNGFATTASENRKPPSIMEKLRMQDEQTARERAAEEAQRHG